MNAWRQGAVVVLIPAWNEERTIYRVVRDIRLGQGFPVVVVDDASSDATREEAVRAGAIMIPMPFRSGAFSAIQAGIRYASARGARICVTFDADGQHEPESIPLLCREMEAAKANVVMGCCPARGSRLRRIAWALFRRLTGFTYRDLTSGLKAYDREAMRVLLSDQAINLDYQDVGSLLLFRDKGLCIREINVRMLDRMDGHSRIFHSWFDVSLYMVRSLLLCLASLIPGRRASKEAGRP